jgi:hypothetical protein
MSGEIESAPETLTCLMPKLIDIRDVKDVHRVLQSHDWLMDNVQDCGTGVSISTMQCRRCRAEWGSALIPLHEEEIVSQN